MSWFGPSQEDDNCCTPPCHQPVVSCGLAATYSGQEIQYSIFDADEAWIDETCFDGYGGTTVTSYPITLDAAPATTTGSYAITSGCQYCIRAINECGTTTCCPTECDACPEGGRYLGVLYEVSGVPDATETQFDIYVRDVGNPTQDPWIFATVIETFFGNDYYNHSAFIPWDALNCHHVTLPCSSWYWHPYNRPLQYSYRGTSPHARFQWNFPTAKGRCVATPVASFDKTITSVPGTSRNLVVDTTTAPNTFFPTSTIGNSAAYSGVYNGGLPILPLIPGEACPTGFSNVTYSGTNYCGGAASGPLNPANFDDGFVGFVSPFTGAGMGWFNVNSVVFSHLLVSRTLPSVVTPFIQPAANPFDPPSVAYRTYTAAINALGTPKNPAVHDRVILGLWTPELMNRCSPPTWTTLGPYSFGETFRYKGIYA